MEIVKFALLWALVFGAGVVCGQQSSADEFNLFCRIMRRADDLMYGPDYIYDESVDREILKEMTILYNATTDDMKDFRQTLWVTKDFFEAHPPPTQPENRNRAHKEIGNLIKDGEKKIEENKKIAVEVNEEMNQAKLSVARGFYGNHVKEVPKDEKNLTEILSDTGSVFVSRDNANASCGEAAASPNRTLLNDFFCVCVGEGVDDSAGPCHPKILPPKKDCKTGCDCCKECCKTGACCGKDCCVSPCTHNCKCCSCWTQMKYASSSTCPLSLSESIKKIEELCTNELVNHPDPIKEIPGLLEEYVGMIGAGESKMDEDGKKIFGHRGRQKGGSSENKVTKCEGANGSSGGSHKNGGICVSYKNHTQDGQTYNIPWHTKFRNYTDFMKSAKNLEDKILKNRADLLLLKSQAWVAYSREKDDENSNLDDMNVSHLFDGTKIPFSLPFLILYLFMIL